MGTRMGQTGALRQLDEPAPYRRLSVNVADDVARAIDEIRARRGWSITELIRRAVSILKFIDDEAMHGGKVLVERDGKIREVTFL
jgi:Ribbon-helix-helix protein, copG family